jgi:hypothetical protein
LGFVVIDVTERELTEPRRQRVSLAIIGDAQSSLKPYPALDLRRNDLVDL